MEQDLEHRALSNLQQKLHKEFSKTLAQNSHIAKHNSRFEQLIREVNGRRIIPIPTQIQELMCTKWTGSDDVARVFQRLGEWCDQDVLQSDMSVGQGYRDRRYDPDRSTSSALHNRRESESRGPALDATRYDALRSLLFVPHAGESSQSNLDFLEVVLSSTSGNEVDLHAICDKIARMPIAPEDFNSCAKAICQCLEVITSDLQFDRTKVNASDQRNAIIYAQEASQSLARASIAEIMTMAPTQPLISNIPPWSPDLRTLYVKNIPLRLTLADLMGLWPSNDSYNLIYLPFSHEHRRTIGCALINFVSPSAAMSFWNRWHNIDLTSINENSRGLEICVATSQGLLENLSFMTRSKKICRIRNPKYQPTIIRRDGSIVDFKQVIDTMELSPDEGDITGALRACEFDVPEF